MASKTQPLLDFPIRLLDETTSFDPDAFDRLIREQGITFRHERAMACPLGMVNDQDERHPYEENHGCSNGFIYSFAGLITCGFLGNNTNASMSDLGRLDGSSAQIVVPRYYDQPSPSSPLVKVELLKYDRLSLADPDAASITVPNWERITSTSAGRDRTEFPIVSVTDLIDSYGKRYEQDKDFAIEGGDIVWGANRPPYDPAANRGTVYSIRYRMRPYWLVDRIMHEVRVAPVSNPFTGERSMLQMPISAEIKREYYYRTDQPNRLNPRNPRQAPQPAPPTYPDPVPTGGYGPRTL